MLIHPREINNPASVISLYNILVVNSKRLSSDFFEEPPLQVARRLLGARLVRLEGGQRLAGLISETEAYCGEEDLACHARAGRTPRTAVMYGPAGHVYVYFTYGVHWMLNFVVQPRDVPAAILIRGIWPVEGLPVIASRRQGRQKEHWTDGPGKICRAFNIDGSLNGMDMCAPDSILFVETGQPVPDSMVSITPRIGINRVPEPWKSKPWRFFAGLAGLKEMER
jgi:DNA-3-methyladenine glycosylase